MKAMLLSGLMLIIAAAPISAAQQPQELTVGLVHAEPATLDPNRSTFAESALLQQLFQPLLRLDENLVPRPAAAQSYDVSPDGTVYTFHLRSDGRWSDGAPVVAQQFAYAWRRLLDPRLAPEYGPFFVDAAVTRARALDDATFEVALAQPFGALPVLASLWVTSPVRPEIVAQDPEGWAQDPATAVGNGPFMLGEWVHDDHLTLAPNPHYAANGRWPRPTLSKITVPFLSDAEGDYAAYVRGERSWSIVPQGQLNQVLNDPALAQEARQYHELTTFWLRMNTRRAPLDEVSVRRTLAHSIDRAALVRDTAGGIGIPFGGVIPPGMPGFSVALGQDISVAAGLPIAGELSLIFRSGTPDEARAHVLHDQWKANLGLDVQLTGVDPGDYQDLLERGEFQLAFGGWTADYPDPQNWFAINFGCDGRLNTSGYCSSLFDQLIARADSTVELTDRVALYDQAQAKLVHDAPIAPLFVLGGLLVVKPWVQSTMDGRLTITPMDGYPGSAFLDSVRIAAH